MPRPNQPPVFAPPYCAPEAAAEQVRQRGFALLSGKDVARWSDADAAQLARLATSWDDLPADAYLLDGGRYRFRRHSCFEFERGSVKVAPHRAHWQPVQYNALHGGIERWFEPLQPQTLANPAVGQLLGAMAALCNTVFAAPPDANRWFVEAHQFRIDTASGIGRPTPEGAHRDGVDLVAVFLVARHGVKGGETRIFEAASPAGQRFTLTEPWSVLLLDDARMVHETTPIQPAMPTEPDASQPAPSEQTKRARQGPLPEADGASGYRDTLVLTWRREAFQGPAHGDVDSA